MVLKEVYLMRNHWSVPQRAFHQKDKLKNTSIFLRFCPSFSSSPLFLFRFFPFPVFYPFPFFLSIPLSLYVSFLLSIFQNLLSELQSLHYRERFLCLQSEINWKQPPTPPLSYWLSLSLSFFPLLFSMLLHFSMRIIHLFTSTLSSL